MIFSIEKVVLDTEGILTDERKLFKSNKTALWFDGENDFLLTQNSSKTSFLGRIHRNKNSNPIRLIPKDFNYDISKDLTECFWFCDILKGRILSRIFSSLYPYDIFYDERPHFTTLGTFLRQKSENEKFKLLDKL